jgi:GNAT superfamily N-acetyltransferase
MLRDGYTDLPKGKIASIVTYLEMRERPAPDLTNPQNFRVHQVQKPDLGWYRELYRRVGSEWLWFGRLLLTDDELRRIIWDDHVEIFSLQTGDSRVDEGFLELDFRSPSEVEIAYFGVAAARIGLGAGKFLLNYALERAWAHTPVPKRVWLHTCNLDHPRALAFYQAAGFQAYKYAIEVGDDPRLAGVLPRDAAPQLPLLSELKD